ncbi:uncharacterized protein LOC119586696 [Penaeus monodon]|uniref:uncharacterized protein LOC119586696 n=1 Tax=Penaeus monodon TaxID=6687 RepID=UPI0018A6F7F8|nr:uncharacterized protein LOC119586696 [Penaeus monodon]
MQRIMYPLLTLLLACCFFCDSAIVGEENHEDCFASDSVLKCDFIESTQDVRMDERVNKFQTVLVMNTGQLLLHPSVCTSVSLYHIGSVMVTSTSQKAANCSGKALHLHNVTVDQIPPYLEMISLENSRLTGTFLSQPYLKKVKVVNSWLRHFDLDTAMSGASEVRLHRTNITTLNRLHMAGRSKLFITDSTVQEVSENAINFFENASVEVMRSVFQDDSTEIVVHNYKIGIVIANITGSWRIKYKCRDTQETHGTTVNKYFSDGKQNDFPLQVLLGVLVVLLAISVSYNCYTWKESRKIKVRAKEEIKTLMEA